MLKRLLSEIQIPCFNANSKSLYYKLDFNAFYHSGNHELQKEIPLLIKFPNSEFGGKDLMKWLRYLI
jgi:hypothetical protein